MAAPLTGYFPLTGDRIVDGMTNGYYWNLDSTRSVDYSISNGFQGQYWFQPSTVALYMGQALDTFSNYADIKFKYLGFYTTPIVASNNGSEINLGLSQTGKAFDSNNVWAFGVFPNSASSVYYGYAGAPGDIYLNLLSPGASLPSYEPGSQGWFLMIHELLHVLGLKHPHDDGGTGRPTFTQLGLGSLDINWATVMSYNDGAAWNNFSWKPATPMALDVLALQYLYGKNSTWNTTDTGYTLKETNFFYTLWDAGGIDTLDASTATSGWTIKLPNVAISKLVDTKVGFAAPTNDLSVGTPHTLVWLTGDYENITGSSYADIIDGNLFNNTINAGPGNDTIDGGTGIDTAIYSGVHSGYTVAIASGGVVLTDKTANRDGSDSLVNVERASFTDGLLALDIAPGQNAGEVYRLYQAAFARTPDMPGVKYHLNDMETKGLPLWQIASNFLASPEFASQYGSNPSDTQYINALYKNVLNRIPAESEVAWYQNQFTTKAMDHQAALIGFSESPENVALVGSAIANGIWLG
jgi:serralysin